MAPIKQAPKGNKQAVANALGVGYRCSIQPLITATKRQLVKVSNHLALIVADIIITTKFGTPMQAMVIRCAVEASQKN